MPAGRGALPSSGPDGPTSDDGRSGPTRHEGADPVDSDAAFDKFRECAVEVLQVPAEKVTKEARFADDLDADSLDLVELVMALEEAFDITVEETELEDIETVGQAFDLISTKI
jgi:acyl carrier protein